MTATCFKFTQPKDVREYVILHEDTSLSQADTVSLVGAAVSDNSISLYSLDAPEEKTAAEEAGRVTNDQLMWKMCAIGRPSRSRTWNMKTLILLGVLRVWESLDTNLSGSHYPRVFAERDSLKNFFPGVLLTPRTFHNVSFPVFNF